MEFLDVLRIRRSIRQYTHVSLPDQSLKQVLAAGLLAPSSRGRRPWELVVVKDKPILNRLSHCQQGSSQMLTGAAAAILVFADQSKSDVWI